MFRLKFNQLPEFEINRVAVTNIVARGKMYWNPGNREKKPSEGNDKKAGTHLSDGVAITMIENVSNPKSEFKI